MMQAAPIARRRGFTLVELLVVIAIIAVMTTFGLMAARSVRDSAHMSTCASNLRAIGTAMLLYANDHDGFYPDTTHTKPAAEAWMTQLEPYLGGNDSSVFICPADPKAALRTKNKASSYILNNLVFAAELDEMAETPEPVYNKPERLPDPSRTMIVFPISDRRPPYRGEDHTHSDAWTNWNMVIRDIAPDIHRRKASTNSSKGHANYLYADGHVANLSAHEIKNRIAKGINIGAIPGTRP